jgi:glycerol uptake facilitator-like aquaporin
MHPLTNHSITRAHAPGVNVVRTHPTGAICGAGVASGIAGKEGSCEYNKDMVAQSWVDEWLWTFLLVLTVFSVASSKRDTNAYFGLAIGAVILASDNFFADVSGGMFNPGVASGICAVALFRKASGLGLWLYWVRVG